MELTDTHCHIYSDFYKLDPDESVANAFKAGVSRMICVGTDVEDSNEAVNFVQNRSHCWASVGIHPHEAKKYAKNSKALKTFEALLERDKVVAIGECGLDYFYHPSPEFTSPQKAQKTIFNFQLDLACKYDLPLIFHVREAFDDFWPIFESYQNLRGVLHSFTDSMENMRRAVSHGLYLGVNGIATFTKDPAQLEVYKTIPLENLLLETDAPFLTPTPYRGTINEPKHVRVVAEFLSDLRGESLDQLAAATTNNARKLFSLE